MKDNRYELAERHGMSKEFIDWFFDKKKNDCGNLWFMTMAVMWEGWKASRGELVIQLPKGIGAKSSWQDGPYLNRYEVIETLNTAGVTVKSD